MVCLKSALASTWLASLALTAQAITSPDGSVEVSTSFPPSNQLGRIYNGQKNELIVKLVNHGTESIVLDSISGFFKESSTGVSGSTPPKSLRNTTVTRYNKQVFPSKTVPISYSVHSEFKPQDLGLVLYLNYIDYRNKKQQIVAYDATVTVVEPAGSLFDPALLLALIIVGAGLFFGGRLGYSYLITPDTSKTGKPSKRSVSQSEKAPFNRPTSPVPGSGTGTPRGGEYDESWIPQHHLPGSGVKLRKTKAGVLSDGESGNESSASRKGKKKA